MGVGVLCLRVAVLHPSLDRVGGAERVVCGEVLGLLKLGWGVRVFCAGRFDPRLFPELRGVVECRWVPELYGHYRGGDIWRALRFALWDFDADVVLANGFPSYFAGFRWPVVWYCHGVEPLLAGGWEVFGRLGVFGRANFAGFRLLFKLGDWAAVRECRAVLANSRFTGRRLWEVYGVRGLVLYPGVRALGLRGRFERVVLMGCRLYPEKRVHLLVEAARLLPRGVEVHICGVGGDEGYVGLLRRLVERCGGGRVFLHVDPPRWFFEELLSRCCCVVALGGGEGFGLTVVEAASAGKPAVAVGEGGYVETVVDGVTGFLVSPSVRDVARCVSKLAGDLELAAEIGARARELYLRMFTVERFARGLDAVLRAVAEGGAFRWLL